MCVCVCVWGCVCVCESVSEREGEGGRESVFRCCKCGALIAHLVTLHENKLQRTRFSPPPLIAYRLEGLFLLASSEKFPTPCH